MKNLKIKMLFIVSILALIILIPKKVNAGIQANKGGTSMVSTTASDFFSQIRTMEGSYGTLGVRPDDVDSSNYNGIDAHMAKNTEWGTAAMLSVSSYGSNANSTSTGNSSGIYNLANGKYEFTANYITSTTLDIATKIKSGGKYSNGYVDKSARIVGDALSLGEIKYDWLDRQPVLSRGYDSLFRCYGGNNYASNYGGGWANANIGSRACVVMGSNL